MYRDESEMPLSVHSGFVFRHQICLGLTKIEARSESAIALGGQEGGRLEVAMARLGIGRLAAWVPGCHFTLLLNSGQGYLKRG